MLLALACFWVFCVVLIAYPRLVWKDIKWRLE